MAFVARPRSKAIGADSNSSSVFSHSYNLQDYGFNGERTDHSGQFNRNIQQLSGFYEAFYNELTGTN